MTLDSAVLYSVTTTALSKSSGLCALAGQIATVSASRRVIAVVDATMREQRTMQGRVAGMGPTSDVYSRANLLTLAARENAQRFSGLLTMLGVENALLDPLTHAPITRGNPLEAEPRLLHAKRFETASIDADVLVIAGGVGRTPDGHLTSLGTGGATLSGLFIAQRLGLGAQLIVGEAGLTEDLPKRARLFARKHGVDFGLVADINDAERQAAEAVSA